MTALEFLTWGIAYAVTIPLIIFAFVAAGSVLLLIGAFIFALVLSIIDGVRTLVINKRWGR